MAILARAQAALLQPHSLTASASDAQGRASQKLHGTTGFPRTAAFWHQQQFTDRKAVRHVAAKICQQNSTKQGAAAHVSTLLDVVTTLPYRKAANALLLGGVEARGGPRDIQICASKNPHGTRGCRAHVQAFGCCSNSHRSKGCQTRSLLLGGVEARGGARDIQPLSGTSKNSQIERLSGTLLLGVASKTPTKQGAAAHVSTLLDVVTTLTNRRAARCTDRKAARRVAAGRCRGSWRCHGYPEMCQQKSSRWRLQGYPWMC